MREQLRCLLVRQGWLNGAGERSTMFLTGRRRNVELVSSGFTAPFPSKVAGNSIGIDQLRKRRRLHLFPPVMKGEEMAHTCGIYGTKVAPTKTKITSYQGEYKVVPTICNYFFFTTVL